MISFDEAMGVVLTLRGPLRTETVTLDEADGRILARPVTARGAAPPTDVSAMDGYAVRDADLLAGPVALTVIGESFPGRGFDGDLAGGGCVRIFTGAPAPRGADRIVMQEDVRREGLVAHLPGLAAGRRHIRPAGSDFAMGDVLLEAGIELDPQRLVTVAAADRAGVEVVGRPRLRIIATGDELREPGAAGGPASVPDTVSFGVAALARRWGAQVLGRARCGDDLPGLERVAALALEDADLVVVSGGASVGDLDFAKAMFESSGLELIFNKVAIKPGKPVWMGRVGGKIVVGLPGNPTSALVTARLFLAPLIASMAGRGAASASAWESLALTAAMEAGGERETFVRGQLTSGGVAPLQNQDAAAQGVLALTDVLIRQRPGDPAKGVGELVSALPL